MQDASVPTPDFNYPRWRPWPPLIRIRRQCFPCRSVSTQASRIKIKRPQKVKAARPLPKLAT